MVKDILPANATDLEIALDRTIARLSATGVPLAQLWSPDDIADDLLPWLAWAFSLEEVWNLADDDDAKRDLVKQSWDLHAYKGTPYAVKRGLEAVGFGGAELVEGFPPLRHDGEALYRDGETYHYDGDRRWAVFDVKLDLGQRRGFDAPTQARVLRAIDVWKNARSHLRKLLVTLKLASADPAPTVGAYIWHVGLRLRATQGPRDGRFLRGAQVRYRHDAAHLYEASVPRGGDLITLGDPILFGPAPQGLRLAVDLALQGERGRSIRFDHAARRGQGFTRGDTRAFTVYVDRLSLALRSRPRARVYHDGAAIYGARAERTPPVPSPSVSASIRTRRYGQAAIANRLLRPGPGFFRDGVWRYDGQAAGPVDGSSDPGDAAPNPEAPQLRARTLDLGLRSTRAPIQRAGGARYGAGLALRGRRADPDAAVALAGIWRWFRDDGLSRAPLLSHDGQTPRDGTAWRALSQVRHGPVRIAY